MLAVEQGRGVDEGFVLDNVLDVELGEHRGRAQRDLLAAGGGFRGEVKNGSMRSEMRLANCSAVMLHGVSGMRRESMMRSVVAIMFAAASAAVSSCDWYFVSGRPYNSVEQRVNSGVPMPRSISAATR